MKRRFYRIVLYIKEHVVFQKCVGGNENLSFFPTVQGLKFLPDTKLRLYMVNENFAFFLTLKSPNLQQTLNLFYKINES